MFKFQLLDKIWKYFSTTIIIIGLTFTLITVNNKPIYSQSITGINAEISSLRSRINRLESEVRNLRASQATPRLPHNPPARESISGIFNNPPVVNNQAVGRSDPLFERLATLLIELKEDVRDLESRLVILEEMRMNNESIK